jgi:hypothetical protein
MIWINCLENFCLFYNINCHFVNWVCGGGKSVSRVYTHHICMCQGYIFIIYVYSTLFITCQRKSQHATTRGRLWTSICSKKKAKGLYDLLGNSIQQTMEERGKKQERDEMKNDRTKKYGRKWQEKQPEITFFWVFSKKFHNDRKGKTRWNRIETRPKTISLWPTFYEHQISMEKHSVQFSLTTERLLGAVSRISLSISLITSFIYTLVSFYHI